MKSTFRNGAILSMIGGSAIYWLCFFALGLETSKAIVDVLALFFSVVVTILWSPAAWSALRSGGKEGKSRLLMGIVIGFLSLSGYRVWIIALQAENSPDWMPTSGITGYFVFWLVFSAILYISSTYEGEDQVPKFNYFYIFIALGVVCFLAGIIFAKHLFLAGILT